MRVIYDTSTGAILGINTNRKQVDGEFSVQISPSELVWGFDNEYYRVNDGNFESKSYAEVEAILAQRAADKVLELQRLEELRQRKEAFDAAAKSDGIRRVTLEQAEEYINGQYDPTDLNAALSALNNATDNAGVKQAVGDALLALRELMAKSKNVDLRLAKALLAAVAEPEE